MSREIGEGGVASPCSSEAAGRGPKAGGSKDPKTWSYTNGPRGELLAVAQPVDGGTFLYDYDGRLNLTAITPPVDGG